MTKVTPSSVESHDMQRCITVGQWVTLWPIKKTSILYKPQKEQSQMWPKNGTSWYNNHWINIQYTNRTEPIFNLVRFTGQINARLFNGPLFSDYGPKISMAITSLLQCCWPWMAAADPKATSTLYWQHQRFWLVDVVQQVRKHSRQQEQKQITTIFRFVVVILRASSIRSFKSRETKIYSFINPSVRF